VVELAVGFAPIKRGSSAVHDESESTIGQTPHPSHHQTPQPKEENEPQINATERSEMDEHFNSGDESNGR
jgi:hypothetical protein